MKKNHFIFSIITLVLLVVFITSFNYFKTTNTYIDDNINNQTKIIKGISMNLEQTAGAGDYKTVTQSKWPTEGYKFNAELSRCENGSTLSWDDTKKAVIVSGNLSDKCYVYFDIIPPITLAEYVISQYTGNQGDNALYYHTSTLTNGAGDNSYRYAGANPNNYVCFGSDASPCPEDNLYRIIGVFGNQVKLIKATIAKSNLLGTDGAYRSDTSYNWSLFNSCPSSTAYNSSNGIYQLANKNIIAAPDVTNGCNEWNYSDLNTTNLNTNFINNIGTAWAEKIATTIWKVGGGYWANIATSVPKTAYQYEVGSNSRTTTYDAKIGLMYVSDYYYSASPSAWTLVGYNESDETKDYRAAKTTNWLYLGSDEWTISRNSASTGNAFIVTSTGFVYNYGVTNSYAVRPSFNLLSSVTYASGSGTSSDPIRIN
jgi:hypothetical protein